MSADKFPKCLAAAERAGAIDVVRVAHGILKAVEHRHSPEQAIAKLRHWQPSLFKSTRNDPAPTPPSIEAPAGWRPSAEACKRKTDEARAALAASQAKYGTTCTFPRDMRKP